MTEEEEQMKWIEASIERYYGKPKWKMSDEQAKKIALFLQEQEEKKHRPK